METPRILIVEDDVALAEMMAGFLGQSGYDVTVEGRGDRAGAIILAQQPALVILDVGLPGKDGFSVCREARVGYGGPILMLTARGDDRSQVEGLDRGADDFLAKPVKPRVLLARVRAALRRASQETPPRGERLEVGDLEIDAAARTCSVGGKPVALTTAEFDLLFILASHAGQVLNRAMILGRLRATDYDGIDRSIDLRVSRLRHKLAEAGCACDIKTIRGAGYLLAEG